MAQDREATTPRRTEPMEAAPDGRLFSSVFARNNPPMIAALAPWLGNARGRVLEIGAGSGQHAAAFALAFPRLDWRASDTDSGCRVSIRAWRAHLRLPDSPPLPLDAASDWALVARLAPFRAVLAMNVIHIAPIEVAQGILAGAARHLEPGGQVFLYGPFRHNGRHVSDGNIAFDAELRARDPAWGIRDTEEIETMAQAAGLRFAAIQAMPANNRLLVFSRD